MESRQEGGQRCSRDTATSLYRSRSSRRPSSSTCRTRGSRRPPAPTERTIATIAFWVLAIVVLFLMFQDRKSPDAQTVEVEGPAFARYLFSNTRAGLFWLPIRIFVGFEWLEAGWHKLTGAGWIDGGSALLGYWQNAVKIPEAPGRPPISFEWYRTFLQFLIDNNAQTWFGWLITFGEIAVGVGLLAGRARPASPPSSAR